MLHCHVACCVELSFLSYLVFCLVVLSCGHVLCGVVLIFLMLSFLVISCVVLYFFVSSLSYLVSSWLCFVLRVVLWFVLMSCFVLSCLVVVLFYLVLSCLASFFSCLFPSSLCSLCLVFCPLYFVLPCFS